MTSIGPISESPISGADVKSAAAGYSTLAGVPGRKPISFVELLLDRCTNVYGVSPCTASGAAGSECYNTFETCQDTVNFSSTEESIMFAEDVAGLPAGIKCFPCVSTSPSITPSRITPTKGLGWRGVVSVKCTDFPHHDRGVDPYVATRTYDPFAQGTFFGKLKARDPYYKGRVMRVYTGYLDPPFSWYNFETRTYIIDSIDGPDHNGNVTIKGRDILALADDNVAQAPSPDTGSLSAAYTAGVSTTLVLQTGEGTDYNTDPYTGNAISPTYPGFALVGDNILKYTGVSTDTLTGVVGGQWGSTDSDLSIDDTVQQGLYFNAVNVVDVLNHLLRTYAGVSEQYIPYDAGKTTPTGVDDNWDQEKSSWLNANTLTHLIAKPTGISKLVTELCLQNTLYIWWKPTSSEIRMRAISPSLKNETPPLIDEASNILKESVKIKEKPKDRISQLWVHYDKIDYTGDDKEENYRGHYIKIDTDSESENAYGEKSVKHIFASWLQSPSLIATLAGRILQLWNETPKEVTFSLDARDATIETGNFARLSTRQIQDVDGSNNVQKVQVLEVKEGQLSHKYDYVAQAVDYTLVRYAFIGPDTLGDYNSETEANRQAYAFIAPDVGNFDDGEPPYWIS